MDNIDNIIDIKLLSDYDYNPLIENIYDMKYKLSWILASCD